MFWGPISQVVVLKLGHRIWGPSLLWKNLGAVNSLPVVFCCSRYGFRAKLCLSLFYLFWCVFFFLICPICRSHSVSRFLSEGFVPHLAVDLGYIWEEVISVPSYITILNQHQMIFLCLKVKEICNYYTVETIQEHWKRWKSSQLIQQSNSKTWQG